MRVLRILAEDEEAFPLPIYRIGSRFHYTSQFTSCASGVRNVRPKTCEYSQRYLDTYH